MARPHSDVHEVTGPASPSSIPTLRHWAVNRARLAGASTGGLAAVELAVSEVVTNAVVHAAGTTTVTMRFRSRGAVMHFEVLDHDPRPPLVRTGRDGRPGGHGLHIVQTLAESWGCVGDGAGGKIVWFVVALHRVH
ncbi:ATP-binding protein [Cellulomonas sp. ACRRI]|uniref:ATP-binding protein n=1 Tax=Cellulomonas sp. ACRRI TaxID=2918188 RepID=UPI001EF3A456|nr:ATP-binding protein [Cellulomonas sp. ACRRI]MCG7284439.1 ATP-binding protein [Cellulomonas sp. ACRRI]